MNESSDNDLKEIETQLKNLSPTPMTDDIISRMEQAMISWETHLPVEEKIVPFSNQADEQSPHLNNINTGRGLQIWGAAAAVILFAGLTAIFMNEDSSESSQLALTPSSPSVDLEKVIPHNISPALSRNITHASNEGITYAGKNEAPFKVLRLEYTEKVTTKDKNGKSITTEKPCVEHVLIPVPIH